MPLTEDKQVLKTSQELVDQLQSLFGKHLGFRPAHARGAHLHGTFTPTPRASTLSTAPHFHASTNPRNRPPLQLHRPPPGPRHGPERQPARHSPSASTSAAALTRPASRTRRPTPRRARGAELLEFLRALAATEAACGEGDAGADARGAVPRRSCGGAAVRAGAETYAGGFCQGEVLGRLGAVGRGWGGERRAVRYEVRPVTGAKHLDEGELEDKEPSFLFDELPALVEEGPIEFGLVAQLAEEGDAVDDATAVWPESREVVELGRVKLDRIVEGDAKEQKHIIFDPIPRVEGIEPTEDPLWEMRAAVYLISGRQRRAAPEVAARVPPEASDAAAAVA